MQTTKTEKDPITLYSDTIGKDAENDWGFKHLKQLRGAICVDIVKNTDTCHNEKEYGLVFRTKDRKILTAWIMRDPEGNGSGHLDIVGNK